MVVIPHIGLFNPTGQHREETNKHRKELFPSGEAFTGRPIPTFAFPVWTLMSWMFVFSLTGQIPIGLKNGMI